ncbi:hypothetical protein THIOM_002639 [Candidatus Thiomargarita nelsonii]|uniref:Uncharacterized protein n=1 Tax=Candidatus Thiomargarita nelsonii TaxID=1003181 RepID=A0A176S0X4_9GAMM|nr:hypothetical protein THIOM_002639 [Candidatus Thiomargarita nelsonii]
MPLPLLHLKRLFTAWRLNNMLSVTDSSVPIVFCEGLKDGLDPVFLHQIIPPGQASSRPVGGKLSMRAFIEGYLTDYNQPN